MKKILATLVTAVVLGASGLAVASATAATPASSTSTTKSTKGASSTAKLTRTAVGSTIRKLAFSTAASTIGITPAELLADMKGGHSIADVATEHSVDPQKVIDAVVGVLDARIQQALDNGKITSAQASKLDQVVATRVPKLVNATPLHLLGLAVRKGASDVSAKTIGITPAALRQDMASGQSIATVATAHSVAPSTVVAALVTAGDKRIDEAVANHHLNDAQAAKLKAKLPQAAQRFVDHARGAGNKAATATS